MKYLSILIPLVLAAVGCGTPGKLQRVQSGYCDATIRLPRGREAAFREFEVTRGNVASDTLRVTGPGGEEFILMKAVQNDDGEMVAHEVLDAAVVSARFRNVAERHGRVDLEFQVTVPAGMMDSRWQLRFNPEMYILGDSVRLDPVIITGRDYRARQLRGYEQYRRFLAGIVSDSLKFVNAWQLEIFLERNIPQLFKYRSDSSFVSDEEFLSCYGVSEQEAVEHYTNRFLVNRNLRRIAKKDRMFHKYVRVPIVSEGVRLDTVMMNADGDFVYNYVQTINTRPKLRKVDIVLSGSIYEQDERLYSMPRTEPLTFYISSLSTFADRSPRYLTRTIGRRVEANSSCYIEFPQGGDMIDEDLGNNRREMERIKDNIRDILRNEEFDLDSVTIASYASPEGSERSNAELSLRRAASAAKFFSRYASRLRDSLRREEGLFISVDGASDAGSWTSGGNTPFSIPFITHSGGENWEMLDYLIDTDNNLSAEEKDRYMDRRALAGLDQREEAMQADPSYGYVRSELYPRTRVVKFDFHLHRKGMVEETVQTTEIDSTYMEGVRAIDDRDYVLALKKLSTYKDYNTAITYLALDRNRSAMTILSGLPDSPQVNYMKAVVYSRWSDDRNAVQCYLNACREDQSFVFRGNLDPEIASLIRRYGLNQDNKEGETL